MEADIFLVEDKLLVGHDRSELREERTLQSLYLDPIRQLVRQNGGRVYRDGPTLTLLVDIKADGRATYAKLREVFASYGEILSGIENGEYQQRAVQVVISGDRRIPVSGSRDSASFANAKITISRVSNDNTRSPARTRAANSA